MPSGLLAFNDQSFLSSYEETDLTPTILDLMASNNYKYKSNKTVQALTRPFVCFTFRSVFVIVM